MTRLRQADFDLHGGRGFVRVLQGPDKQPCQYNIAKDMFEVAPGEFSIQYSLDLDEETMQAFEPDHWLGVDLDIDGQKRFSHSRRRSKHYEDTITSVSLYSPVEGYQTVRRLEFGEIKVSSEILLRCQACCRCSCRLTSRHFTCIGWCRGQRGTER